jgi:hypothetical protein
MRSAITPPRNAPLAHPIANRLFSAAELLLSKPKRIQESPCSNSEQLQWTEFSNLEHCNTCCPTYEFKPHCEENYGSNEPIIPCRTIIWNVFTFITDLVATQESLQIEGGGRTSLLDKCNLQDEEYYSHTDAYPVSQILINTKLNLCVK